VNSKQQQLLKLAALLTCIEIRVWKLNRRHLVIGASVKYMHVLMWQQHNGGFVSVLILFPSLVSTRT